MLSVANLKRYTAVMDKISGRISGCFKWYLKSDCMGFRYAWSVKIFRFFGTKRTIWDYRDFSFS
nr:MAG TPA: hypothetical protein [Caudoviricetes sp.]